MSKNEVTKDKYWLEFCAWALEVRNNYSIGKEYERGSKWDKRVTHNMYSDRQFEEYKAKHKNIPEFQVMSTYITNETYCDIALTDPNFWRWYLKIHNEPLPNKVQNKGEPTDE